jgi:hypothetical protein
VKRLVAAAVITVAYAWWATSVAPFTAICYVLIAVPSVLAVVLYAAVGAFSRDRTDIARYYQARAGDSSFSSITPWLLVLCCVLALESVGLALGGRSPGVPTLSTAVDHLLVEHWERGILFVLWVWVGASPLWRLWRQRQKNQR